MFKLFKTNIERKFPLLNSSKVLIAISGGVDSVVLTYLCHICKLNISLAHCNFNLRGKESNADEAFVLDLAEDLDLEVFIESFETKAYARANKLSMQMAARELRYNWFEELASQLGFNYILTAHHADDDLETFLINLSRGTGLEGLTGIPEINDNIIRPLLSFSREQIVAFARKENLDWRNDSSNASTKYLRNELRHNVIPVLKGINPKLLQNFVKTQGFLKEAKTIVDDYVETVSDQVIKEIDEGQISFDIAKIQALNNPKAYLYELLKAYNFTEWDDVYNLLSAQSGKQVLSVTHRLIKNRDYLLLTVNNHAILNDGEVSFIISENEKQIQTHVGTLYFNEVDTFSKNEAYKFYSDKDKLKYPLELRKWREGDYFYPFGMTGKKKLSKYFKDEKLSLIDKENVWVLCSQDDIIWIINRRGDNRFKVSEDTIHVLKLEFKKN